MTTTNRYTTGVHRATRSGFTLTEMLVVMSGLGIATLIGSLLLVASLRADRVGAAANDSLTWRKHLAETFRADIRAAREEPRLVTEPGAESAVLVLHTRGSGTVTYERTGTRLERFATTPAGPSRQVMPLGPDTTHVDFVLSPGGRLVTLQVVERGKTGERETGVTAAVGGDIR